MAFTFFINPEIADAFRIDSILCLADAKHIALHLEEEKADGAVNEAVSQVAHALSPTPYTLHPIPNTLYLTPYALRQIP